MNMATTPKTMCTNIGGMERMLRVIAGIAILYMGPGLGLGMWSLIGIIPILTGTTGWCPLYIPFGISTYKTYRTELFPETVDTRQVDKL